MNKKWLYEYNKGDVLVLHSNATGWADLPLVIRLESSPFGNTLHYPSKVLFRIFGFNNTWLSKSELRYVLHDKYVKAKKINLLENGLKVPEDKILWLAALEAIPLIDEFEFRFLNFYDNLGPSENIETILYLYT